VPSQQELRKRRVRMEKMGSAPQHRVSRRDRRRRLLVIAVAVVVVVMMVLSLAVGLLAG